jgi:hypothetical protein
MLGQSRGARQQARLQGMCQLPAASRPAPPASPLHRRRLLTIGISAHQKLELLKGLLQLLGWESVTVFGDCFDEVTLLDPVKFPGAVKVMAREICRCGALF